MTKKKTITFPIAFEVLIWLLYVCLYKYSYYLDQAHLPILRDSNFPYLQVCLYSICSTLYLIPYYRWAVPKLLHLKRYWLLFGATVLVFIFLMPINDVAWGWIFAKCTNGLTVHRFFVIQSSWFGPDLNLMFTDLLAFFCIAFARFSYQNEQLRHQMETDNLQLQLGMLKAQLQPHFLFNTLNGLYGMSLTESKDTPRFILLLSQMMQYILYDCDTETVNLQDEMTFLKGYFELEQKKFPKSKIILDVPELIPDVNVPPLLFLPLVENSFKHGKHKLEDTAGVEARLTVSDKEIRFIISNDVYEQSVPAAKPASGGIGLINIKKRLELYYRGRYELSLDQKDNQYIATLIIKL
ncbi:histidine kinase [Mucilaginibacter sp. BJC16-A38]|uniref:sensor histidine kinase n=1 Tax=Mucilaginibacter phenanthrenivorans TaxID=1234842 RepID=UPI0021573F55|nr:histidine kinase [Mucilaginibacter phenanthrenivorans]MCR8559520.1 histidine kinase [Mucilaginibacter phenanthrenivorans]